MKKKSEKGGLKRNSLTEMASCKRLISQKAYTHLLDANKDHDDQ